MLVLQEDPALYLDARLGEQNVDRFQCSLGQALLAVNGLQGRPACHTVDRHSINALEWRADGEIIGQLQYNVLSSPYVLECRELVLESSRVGSKGIYLPQPPAPSSKDKSSAN